MPQKFDIKTHEDNQRRKVVLKKFANLLPSAQDLLLEIIAGEAKRTHLFRTCITCNHFEVLDSTDGKSEQIEKCKLVNKRPPAVIIADGCDKYKTGYYHDEDVPF